MANLQKDSASILILSDYKAGTTNQCEALAQALESSYEVIEIAYSCLARLPNFLAIDPFLRISKNSRNKLAKLSLKNTKYLISGGRRLAPIALALKERSESLKLIQIMNPGINFDNFDLVILPKHDQNFNLKQDNVIESIGALTKDNLPSKNSSHYNDLFDSKRPIIALLLGGKSKTHSIDQESAKSLGCSASKIVKNMKGSLLVISSRRTQNLCLKALESNLSCPHKILRWDQVKDDNPYPEVLRQSDYFIVTGDSVSMISESCQTGKPVYIFDEKSISSKKHRRFHQNLYQENYAKKLDSNIESLIDFTPKKLNQAKKIAAIIKSRI